MKHLSRWVSLEGMNPQEVADALSTDFQLRMQVEKLAGRAEDESAEAVMEEEVDTENGGRSSRITTQTQE